MEVELDREMEFNNKKCSMIEMGKGSRRLTKYYKMGNTFIRRRTEEEDLGVMYAESLSPEKHLNKVLGETYNLLRNIRVAFAYLDEDMIRMIFVTLIHPKLEYAAVGWSPWLKGY